MLLNAASEPRHTLVVVFCRQTFENYSVLFGPFLFFQGYFGGGGGGAVDGGGRPGPPELQSRPVTHTNSSDTQPRHVSVAFQWVC